MRFFKYMLCLLLCLPLLFFSGCGPAPARQAASPDKLPVVVSFHAMELLAKAVGGEHVDVHTIIPSGAEPHDFQPKSSDLEALMQARLFIINGCNLEPWAEKAVEASHNEDLKLITASDGANLHYVEMKTILPGREAQTLVDPHVWLSPENAKTEAHNMATAFAEADPEHATYYKQRYDDFARDIDTLRSEYAVKFAAAPSRTFVTGHAAFSYLARDFNLTQLSLTNVFASGEPSVRHLKELADACKEAHIRTIFVEHGESPKIAETLAQETGATLATIDTLEEGEEGDTYLGVMQDNLEKIYQSLQ